MLRYALLLSILPMLCGAAAFAIGYSYTKGVSYVPPSPNLQCPNHRPEAPAMVPAPRVRKMT